MAVVFMDGFEQGDTALLDYVVDVSSNVAYHDGRNGGRAISVFDAAGELVIRTVSEFQDPVGPMAWGFWLKAGQGIAHGVLTALNAGAFDTLRFSIAPSPTASKFRIHVEGTADAVEYESLGLSDVVDASNGIYLEFLVDEFDIRIRAGGIDIFHEEPDYNHLDEAPLSVKLRLHCTANGARHLLSDFYMSDHQGTLNIGMLSQTAEGMTVGFQVPRSDGVSTEWRPSSIRPERGVVVLPMFGQSNMVGFARDEDLQPENQGPQPDVWVWDPISSSLVTFEPGVNNLGYGTASFGGGRGACPAVTLLKRIKEELEPSTDIVLIKVARESTWIYPWLRPDGTEYPLDNYLTWGRDKEDLTQMMGLFVKAIRDGYAAAVSTFGSAYIPAIFYMQGENETLPADEALLNEPGAFRPGETREVFANSYGWWLNRVIDTLFEEVDTLTSGQSTPHFIIGNIHSNLANPPFEFKLRVRETQIQIGTARERVHTVNLDGFPLDPLDGTHFTAAGYEGVGEALYQVYRTLADDWRRVDDQDSDGDSTWLESDEAGARSLFRMSSLRNALYTPRAIQVRAIARELSGDASIRFAGNSFDYFEYIRDPAATQFEFGQTFQLGAAFAPFREVLEVAPSHFRGRLLPGLTPLLASGMQLGVRVESIGATQAPDDGSLTIDTSQEILVP